MMASNGSYNDRPTIGVEAEFSNDPASGGFFGAEFRKHDDLKNMLDSNKDGLKLEAMKRIIGMIAKGKDASELFPAVVKNVVSKNLEVKKLVYVYLVRYAEEQQDLALLSISTFQRALKDPNQLIRASALRVLSSIRVPVIVPIMMLAIKDAVNDMSPYVRKTAAHAIPKLYSLDSEMKDQLIEVIEKLLSDKTTLVVGSAVMAFEVVCPEKIELIHKNYRKLCNLLVDVEEWGQVVIMHMLTRYARTQFLDPNKYDTTDANEEKAFYESDNSEQPEEESKEKKSYIMDPDHRLLLRNCKPLLQSRNSAVVMAVVQLYYYLSPRNEMNVIAKALIRLIHSHREIQSVVLGCIATLSTKHKGMFEPYIKSFFVRSCDPTHIKILKLEILTNLTTESNISFILREFQTYVSSPDTEFAAANIQAIGRCASSISSVTDTCLNGLVSLLSNRNETVVAESVVVIKKLLQMQLTDHRDIIVHMSRLMDNLTIPMARASILWLLGEYADKVTKIAPDVLRKIAKNFTNEEDIVKLQAITLAAKLYLTNPKQTKLLTQYVFNLSKYDQSYDIRDRTRFLRQLIMPQNDSLLISKYAKKIILAPKPAPVLQSKFKDRDLYQLGSLSHYLNSQCVGYHDLPSFPEVAPDASVRNVEVQMPWQELELVKKKKTPTKKSTFYSENESSSEDEESDGSSASDDEDDDDEGESGKSAANGESSSEESDSEDETGSASEASSREELPKPREVATTMHKPKLPPPAQKSSSSEASESSGSGKDDSGSSSSSEEESEEDVKVKSKAKSNAKIKREQASKNKTKKRNEENKKSIDLLLDLDDFVAPDTIGPVIQPTLMSALPVLTPSGNMNEKIIPTPTVFASTVSAAYIPTVKHELLNRYTGKGLCVSYRFCRSPSLFSSNMTTIELTLHNASEDDICNVHVPDKKLGKLEIKGFPEIALIAPNATFPVSLSIDYNESTQPASFEIVTKKDKFSVTVKVPVGEIIQPIMLSEGEFAAEQNKLKGMNENSSSVELSSGHADADALVQYVYEAANLMQIQNLQSGPDILRFASQTPSSKSLVLVTVNIHANSKATITVNCERMVISSMLLKELKQALVK